MALLPNLHVRDLLHVDWNWSRINADGAVLHHGVGGQVVLNVVHVQEHRLLPVVVALAGVDQLWDFQLRNVHLDEVHEFLGFVLGLEDAELCVHANVRPLAAEAAVEECEELLKVPRPLVVSDELLEVIRVHDDVHACNLCTVELLSVTQAMLTSFSPSGCSPCVRPRRPG